MLSAVDINGNKHFIDEVSRREQFFCPICQQKLMQKRKGEQRRAHFAHYGLKDKAYVPCTDKWHYDKTDWHYDWQLQFPLENYEVVVAANGKKHIADILISNTVLEFQHSSISWKEFKERTDFYFAAGYKVIWLFDLRRQFSEGRIHKEIWDQESYVWSYVKKPFRDISLDDVNAKIFIQLTDDNGMEACIEYVQAASIGFKEFWTDEAHKQTGKDFVQLVKNGQIDTLFSRNGVTRDSDIDECEEKSSDSLPPIDGASTIQRDDVASAESEDGENDRPYIHSKPNYPPAQDSKTVWQLWDPNYQSMVVQNTTNMDKLLIQGDAGDMRTDWKGRVLGTYTNDHWDGSRFIYTYSPKEYVIKDARAPIWKLVYAKKRAIKKQDPLKQWFEANNADSEPEPKTASSLSESPFVERITSPQPEANAPKEPRTHTETRAEKHERHFKEAIIQIDQQHKAVYDTDGGRWVKCQICGNTKPASEFIVYGGDGTINLGKCKQCFNK